LVEALESLEDPEVDQRDMADRVVQTPRMHRKRLIERHRRIVGHKPGHPQAGVGGALGLLECRNDLNRTSGDDLATATAQPEGARSAAGEVVETDAGHLHQTKATRRAA